MPAPLGNVDNIAQPARFAAFGYKFSQHDVAERQPEQQPQAN